MTGPLSGYRIIDMTSVVSGPLCTMMLGDQGADVIKIENPDGGDFTRAMSNRRGDLSAPFINNNRSKRSLAVNTKTKKGLEIVVCFKSTLQGDHGGRRPGWVYLKWDVPPICLGC